MEGEFPICRTDKVRKSRKKHRCCECGSGIEMGEDYWYVSGVWPDIGPDSFKMCLPCARLFKLCSAYTGPYDTHICFTQMEEWIIEFHVSELPENIYEEAKAFFDRISVRRGIGNMREDVIEDFLTSTGGRVMEIKISKLSSGYWHIRGDGPCNWAQPPHWPCSMDEVRANAFPEACEQFFQAVEDILESECCFGGIGNVDIPLQKTEELLIKEDE